MPCVASITTLATNPDPAAVATERCRNPATITPQGTKSSTLNTTCSTATLVSAPPSPWVAIASCTAPTNRSGCQFIPSTPCWAHQASDRGGSGSQV